MLFFIFLKTSTIILSVVDENGNPIPYCAYTIYRDTLKIGGGYCDENGNIKIENLDFGSYKISIEYIGYESKEIEINLNRSFVNLGKISLNPKGIILREQQVISSPPQIIYEQGKRVIRPSQNIANLGGTALDVLRNTPGVNVDNNDNVEIRGSSNITVLINGRPTSLDVSEALKQIPASQIDRIEIITNPSAKFEAEGNIIMNVVLRKTSDNLNFSLNSVFGTYNNYGVNLLSGFSREKIRLSFSLNYNKLNFPFKLYSKRETSNEEYTSNGYMTREINPYGIRLNLDYNLTSKDVLSFEGNLSHWGFSHLGNATTYGSKNYSTDFVFDIGGINSSLYLGWNRNFINSGISYSVRTKNEESYNLDKDSSDNVIDGNKRTENGPIHHFRFNLDYDNKNLAFGYLGILINRKDTVENYKYYQSDFSLTSGYKVDFYRFTNAGYITYNKNIKDLNLQLGIRFENTFREVDTIKRTFSDFFPSLNFSYRLSNTNQVYLNYSRRINHPKPWLLEPYEVQLDQITKQRGNPYLTPEYINSFEIGFQNLYLNADLYYRKTDNNIEQITIFENNYFVNYSENVGFSEFFGSEISINLRRSKFIEFNTSLNLYQLNVYSFTKRSSLSYDIKSSINLLFLQIIGVYNSPRKTSQGEIYENYYVDVGLRFPYKSFLFIFSFQDIFKISKFTSVINSSNFYQYQQMSKFWPSFNFLLIYNFQNFRKISKPKQNVEEDMEGF
ncbi:MAG: TonB-dependent receptor [candidate division WOR-3 bacterium]